MEWVVKKASAGDTCLKKKYDLEESLDKWD